MWPIVSFLSYTSLPGFRLANKQAIACEAIGGKLMDIYFHMAAKRVPAGAVVTMDGNENVRTYNYAVCVLPLGRSVPGSGPLRELLDQIDYDEQLGVEDAERRSEQLRPTPVLIQG